MTTEDMVTAVDGGHYFPHAKAAHDWLEIAEEHYEENKRYMSDGDAALLAATIAQAHATLALVERTGELK